MDETEQLKQMMEGSADALGLTLPETGRDAILRDMAAILEQAQICEASLADETVEIAPTFRP